MALSSNTKKLFIRVLLFLVYMLIGAGIFYAIEQTNEVQLRRENTFDSQYENFTKRYNISKKDMQVFIEGLQKALRLGYNATKKSWPSQYRWDFMNAFHFAGNVVTTIGYGHITPVTLWGQIVCVIYALLGIPLTGLTLRSIGNRISELIGSILRYLDRRFYNRETERIEIKTAIVAFGCLLVIIFLPAIGFAHVEGWQYMEAVYFCFVTLTTIGFGDFVPGVDRERYSNGVEVILEFLNLFYMVLGLAVMSGVIVSISGVIEEKTKNFGAVDPLEALRNIRVENLNSRALKKLGYKMGPAGPQGPGGPANHTDHDHRLPPKLAPRTIAVSGGNTMERSRSADTMDFQGPTPVLHLNKKPANMSGSNEACNTGSPASSKIFNNKIAPVALPHQNLDSEMQNNNSDGVQKPSENHSSSTESAEEVRASDEDNEVEKTLNESNEVRQEAELDGLEPFSDDPKNNLVVKVQVTPMPSPRESPVPMRASMDSIPLTNVKSTDADSEHIETYEGGSIDSQAFHMDRTDSLEESKTNSSVEKEEGRTLTTQQSNDTTNAKNTYHKPRTKDITHSKTRNGIIPKTNQSKAVLKKGGDFKPVEHIDLGDRSLSKKS